MKFRVSYWNYNNNQALIVLNIYQNWSQKINFKKYWKFGRVQNLILLKIKLRDMYMRNRMLLTMKIYPPSFTFKCIFTQKIIFSSIQVPTLKNWIMPFIIIRCKKTQVSWECRKKLRTIWKNKLQKHIRASWKKAFLEIENRKYELYLN